MMIFLPDIPGIPVEVWALAIRSLIAWPIAYYAKRKGYSFWVFLVVGALLDPLACLVLAIAIPRIRSTGNGEAVVVPGKKA